MVVDLVMPPLIWDNPGAKNTAFTEDDTGAPKPWRVVFQVMVERREFNGLAGKILETIDFP